MFANRSQQPCEPVSSPVGRFHHDGQTALYTSWTEEGAGVAIKRYIKPEDPDRIIVPLQINTARVYDLRSTEHSDRGSMVWQSYVEDGLAAPTWQYSDPAREAGAQGMLYASRSMPELTHLVMFDVSAEVVQQAGDSKPWSAGSSHRL